MQEDEKITKLFIKYGYVPLRLVEYAVLIMISIATIVAIGQELLYMVQNRQVKVEDLLLLFIYLEVLAMVSNYATSGKLPIRMPIYIAIVALARHLILGVAAMDVWHITAISFSSLVLALTVYVIKLGQFKFSKVDN